MRISEGKMWTKSDTGFEISRLKKSNIPKSKFIITITTIEYGELPLVPYNMQLKINLAMLNPRRQNTWGATQIIRETFLTILDPTPFDSWWHWSGHTHTPPEWRDTVLDTFKNWEMKFIFLFKKMSGDTFENNPFPLVTFDDTVKNPPPYPGAPLKCHRLFELPLMRFFYENVFLWNWMQVIGYIP